MYKKFVSMICGVLSILWAPGLLAQSAATGALTGTVTDQSGAAVPNVAVTLTSADTNQARSVTSTADGSYKFALLPPGTYRVRFTAGGFKVSEVGGVAINVTETSALNRVLELGAQSDQVTVAASAETLQTVTSTLGTTVGARPVAALPLTTRNYTQILGLSAGANVAVNNASALGRGTQDVSTNGAASTQNNYQMDGVSVGNFWSNAGGDSGSYAGVAVPNPDAVQEFKIQTSTYDASYGRNPGANVNVVTKSGTNSLHGSLFEFFRNTDLNAVDFFRNRGCGVNRTLCAQSGGVAQVLNQNQFGGTFGMPIKKDKLFLFVSYQETRQINGVGANGYSTPTLPPLPGGDRSNTAAFRAAVGALNCPANHTGTSFNTVAGGVQVACDGSNISPVAINILQAKLPNGAYWIPSSGATGFSVVPFSDPARYTEHQALANFDYLITPKNTLSGRFFTSQAPENLSFTSNSNSTATAGLGGTELPGTPAGGLTSNTNSVLKLTSILSNTLVNEARISMQRFIVNFSSGDPFTDLQLGITPIVPTFPGTPINIAGQLNIGGTYSDQIFNPQNMGEVADSISWSHGSHTIRAGVEYERDQYNLNYKGLGRGNLTFQSFADFLIGRAGCPPSALQAGTCGVSNPGNTTGTANSNVSACAFCILSGPSGIIHGQRDRNMNLFVQDDFKVNSKLTLNLGLRWEYDGTLTDKYGNNTNIWLTQLGPNANVPSTPGQTPANLAGYAVPNNFVNFYGQPPAGVILTGSDHTIQNDVPLNNFAPRFGFAWQAAPKLVVRGGVGMFYDLLGGRGVLAQGYPYAVAGDYSGSGANPYSLAVPFNPALTLGFAGRWANFATLTTSNINTTFYGQRLHTPLTRQYNLNVQYEFRPSWVLEVGFVGSSGINQEFSQSSNPAYLASPTNPINGLTVNTVQNAQLRVPYLGFQPTGLRGAEFDGIYNYTSLQATVRKVFSHGFSFQGSYTWSKNLTDEVSTNNPVNLGQQYGQAAFNRPQRLVMNYSWDLPFGHPQGLAGKLVSGWSVSGVTVIQNGAPLTFTDATSGSIYGLTGSGRAQMCPGTTYSAIPTSGGVESRLGGVSGGSGYFKASAFCGAPVIGNGLDFGNSGVGIELGPGQFNWDVSLAKSTRVGGLAEGATLQIRSEFFNAFNHPQFNNPGVAVSSPATFGIITSETVSPRLIQFALKYVF